MHAGSCCSCQGSQVSPASRHIGMLWVLTRSRDGGRSEHTNARCMPRPPEQQLHQGRGALRCTRCCQQRPAPTPDPCQHGTVLRSCVPLPFSQALSITCYAHVTPQVLPQGGFGVPLTLCAGRDGGMDHQRHLACACGADAVGIQQHDMTKGGGVLLDVRTLDVVVPTPRQHCPKWPR